MSNDPEFCSNCRSPLVEDAQFCSKCGQPADEAVAQMSKTKRRAGRGLVAGLALLWVGVLLLAYVSRALVMPLESWLAYFVAGLGVVLVISGLVGYVQGRSFAFPPKIRKHPKLSKAARFSGQLGVEHPALIGKKILFEFDPSTPYQKIVRDFALECAQNKEKIIVLTPAGSVIQHALEHDEDVNLINLSSDTMLSSILEKNPERPLSLVYDSLTDLALSADPRTAYRFAMNSLKQLSDPQITIIFLLNPSAHDPKDVSSLRGLFSHQVVYGKDGMSSVKFG